MNIWGTPSQLGKRLEETGIQQQQQSNFCKTLTPASCMSALTPYLTSTLCLGVVAVSAYKSRGQV